MPKAGALPGGSVPPGRPSPAAEAGQARAQDGRCSTRRVQLAAHPGTCRFPTSPELHSQTSSLPNGRCVTVASSPSICCRPAPERAIPLR